MTARLGSGRRPSKTHFVGALGSKTLGSGRRPSKTLGSGRSPSQAHFVGALVYADPYSGQEILLLPGKIPSGAAYDPRRTDPPVAWLSGCSHCLGDSRHLSIHVRRQIQLLSSRSKSKEAPANDYDVPCCEYKIQHWIKKDGVQRALVYVPGTASISVAQEPRDRLIVSAKIGSSIALRQLRFLFSGRIATPHEILAVALPLAALQEARRHSPGYRSACRRIDWVAVAKQAEQALTELAS